MDLDLDDNQQRTELDLDDIYEYSIRVSNQIKNYIEYDEYDSLLSYFSSLSSNFLSCNLKIYFKILKMKFIFKICIGNIEEAKEFYKNQIEAFIRTMISSRKALDRLEGFFNSTIYEGSSNIYSQEYVERLLDEEKEGFCFRIFKQVFLFMSFGMLNRINQCNQSQERKEISMKITNYISRYNLNSGYDIKKYSHISDLEDFNNEDPDDLNIAHSQIENLRKASGNDFHDEHQSKSKSGTQTNVYNITETEQKIGKLNQINKSKIINNSLNYQSNTYLYPSKVLLNPNKPAKRVLSSFKYDIAKQYSISFDKKENIDKKIIRKFKQFLFDNKKSELLAETLSSDIKSNTKFWKTFIESNLLPPYKHVNPLTGEEFEFKSFNNNYLIWLFSIKGSVELYSIFINEKSRELLQSVLYKKNYKTISNEQKNMLFKYINDFHYIYSNVKKEKIPLSIDKANTNISVENENENDDYFSEIIFKNYLGNEDIAYTNTKDIYKIHINTNSDNHFQVDPEMNNIREEYKEDQDMTSINTINTIYSQSVLNMNKTNKIKENLKDLLTQSAFKEKRESSPLERRRLFRRSRDYENFLYPDEIYPHYKNELEFNYKESNEYVSGVQNNGNGNDNLNSIYKNTSDLFIPSTESKVYFNENEFDEFDAARNGGRE